MKKLLFILLMFCTSYCFSQSKDTTQRDTSKTKVDTTVKYYSIILSDREIGGLFSLMKEADEKPSIINAWINLLSGRAQEIKPKESEVIENKEKSKSNKN